MTVMPHLYHTKDMKSGTNKQGLLRYKLDINFFKNPSN